MKDFVKTCTTVAPPCEAGCDVLSPHPRPLSEGEGRLPPLRGGLGWGFGENVTALPPYEEAER